MAALTTEIMTVQATGDYGKAQALLARATVRPQVQAVLDKVVRAVEFLFGFTLAAGVVVLFAAVTATREERAREFATVRTLGA